MLRIRTRVSKLLIIIVSSVRDAGCVVVRIILRDIMTKLCVRSLIPKLRLSLPHQIRSLNQIIPIQKEQRGSLRSRSSRNQLQILQLDAHTAARSYLGIGLVDSV